MMGGWGDRETGKRLMREGGNKGMRGKGTKSDGPLRLILYAGLYTLTLPTHTHTVFADTKH